MKRKIFHLPFQTMEFQRNEKEKKDGKEKVVENDTYQRQNERKCMKHHL